MYKYIEQFYSNYKTVLVNGEMRSVVSYNKDAEEYINKLVKIYEDNGKPIEITLSQIEQGLNVASGSNVASVESPLTWLSLNLIEDTDDGKNKKDPQHTYLFTEEFLLLADNNMAPGVHILNKLYQIDSLLNISKFTNLLICTLREGYLQGCIIDFPRENSKYLETVKDESQRAEYSQRINEIYGYPFDLNSSPHASMRAINNLVKLELIKRNGSTPEGFYKYVLTEYAHKLLATINANIERFGDEGGLYNSAFPKEPLQLIVYGAPGTGKSFGVEEDIKKYGMKDIRTTFHPDSDYSTFVGCYKPIKERVTTIYSVNKLHELYTSYKTSVPNRPLHRFITKYYHSFKLLTASEASIVFDKLETDSTVTAEVPKMLASIEELSESSSITYSFVPQAFIKAYISSWKDLKSPHVLVIEEVNRGNCAQIFGDLFQLLDRNEIGFSKYPITADDDIKNVLNDEFAGLAIDNGDEINTHYKDDVIADVLNGSRLLLPNNLYIWATMNTSDQSLFPIDSAFKRRWDWKYVPISNAGKKWKIQVNGSEYDWWSFIEHINKKIGDTTHSEDKKLGYFFCKADRKEHSNDEDNTIISADRFVGKVLFYIYNDVYKDFGFEDAIFKDKGDDSELSFQCYFMPNGKPNEAKIETFLKNLEVKLASELEDNNEIVDEEENPQDGVIPHSTSFKVIIDGETIEETEQFETYLAVLRKIGLDRVEPIAAESQDYHRFDCPFVSKEKLEALKDKSNFSYVEADGYQVIKGINKKGMTSFLKYVAEKLNIDINIE